MVGRSCPIVAGLVGFLASGGVLAVQMARQNGEPSHALTRDIAAQRFGELFDFTKWSAPVSASEEYLAMLQPLGQVQVWETVYYQVLAPVSEGHPVRHSTASTAMRPLEEKLPSDALATFEAEYDARLADAYPIGADGAVLFPSDGCSSP